MIRPLREIEKQAILEAIMAMGGMVQAARALGIGKTTIYRKLNEYGIQVKANEILAEIRRQQTLKLTVPK